MKNKIKTNGIDIYELVRPSFSLIISLLNLFLFVIIAALRSESEFILYIFWFIGILIIGLIHIFTIKKNFFFGISGSIIFMLFLLYSIYDVIIIVI
jgi:hypothetical protein